MKKRLGILLFALLAAVGLTGAASAQPVCTSGCAPVFDPCSPFICPTAFIGVVTCPGSTTATVAKKSVKKKHVYKHRMVYKHHMAYKHYKHKIYKHAKMKATAKCAAPVCAIPVCVVPICAVPICGNI